MSLGEDRDQHLAQDLRVDLDRAADVLRSRSPKRRDGGGIELGHRGHATRASAPTRSGLRGLLAAGELRQAASGSDARMSVSPTSTASTPTRELDLLAVDDARLRNDRLAGRHVGEQLNVLAMSTEKSARSRLLIPIRSASISSATSSSCSSWTSTSASRSSSRASRKSSASSSRSSEPTTRRTASAPAARASTSWYGSTVKSLRRIGRLLAARASAGPRASRRSGAPRSGSRARPPRRARRRARSR